MRHLVVPVLLALAVPAPPAHACIEREPTPEDWIGPHDFTTAPGERELWTEGTGHSGDRSMWEAYNAVAESVDHDAELWRVRGPRTAALLDGRLRRIKNRVLATLVTAATSSN